MGKDKTNLSSVTNSGPFLGVKDLVSAPDLTGWAGIAVALSKWGMVTMFVVATWSLFVSVCVYDKYFDAEVPSVSGKPTLYTIGLSTLFRSGFSGSAWGDGVLIVIGIILVLLTFSGVYELMYITSIKESAVSGLQKNAWVKTMLFGAFIFCIDALTWNLTIKVGDTHVPIDHDLLKWKTSGICLLVVFALNFVFSVFSLYFYLTYYAIAHAVFRDNTLPC